MLPAATRHKLAELEITYLESLDALAVQRSAERKTFFSVRKAAQRDGESVADRREGRWFHDNVLGEIREAKQALDRRYRLDRRRILAGLDTTPS